MKLKLYTPDGSQSAEKDFAIPEYQGDKGLPALRQVLIAYQANKRQGTSSTKTSSTVHGTGKKPFRQKGTGMARQGARNRAQHYHGAVSHGPQPRDYRQKISSKMRQLALGRALFERASAGEIDVIERFDISQPKTRLFNGVVTQIAPSAKKLLVVDDAWADTVALAARNIEMVSLALARELNALDLAQYDRILMTERGIEQVLSRLNGATAKKGAAA